MVEKVNEDILTRRLYGVFRIPEETYIVTVKLLVIYEWIEPQLDGKEDAAAVLKRLRSELKRMSNVRKVDALYRMAEHEKLLRNGRYAPSNAKPPARRQDYISGWLPY